MDETGQAPESAVTGQVADAVADNWVDRIAPAIARPYLRLSRADRPAGTWLLFIPCLWGASLAAAANGSATLWTLWWVIACGIGSFLMRGAGCTWNDISDRHIDAEVARTRSRPLPSGQVTVAQAVVWMCVQAILAFFILLTFPGPVIGLGIAALLPVAIYPFAKRFTWWPQVFLGVAFNWGALLAWTAAAGHLAPAAVALYAAGIAWTLFYDTIYAHQDREDDALIGVKSTARLFGAQTARWLAVFLAGTIALMALATVLALGPRGGLPLTVGLIGVAAMGGHLLWQLRALDIEDADRCLRLFRSNRDAGLLPVPFFAAALFL